VCDGGQADDRGGVGDRDDVAQGSEALGDVGDNEVVLVVVLGGGQQASGRQLVVSSRTVEADRARERLASDGGAGALDQELGRGTDETAIGRGDGERGAVRFPPVQALDDVADREVGVEARVDAAGEHHLVQLVRVERHQGVGDGLRVGTASAVARCPRGPVGDPACASGQHGAHAP